MTNYLDFEKPLAEIEGKAEELRALARANEEMDVEAEAAALDKKAADILRDLYKDLTPWRKCQVARHPERPALPGLYRAVVQRIHTPLRATGTLPMIWPSWAGLARLEDTPVVVIGHEKGADTKSRIERNFGMARPEGYRKAIRLMELADKFNLPVVTLVDTPGAYPGQGRGRARPVRGHCPRNRKMPADRCAADYRS